MRQEIVTIFSNVSLDCTDSWFTYPLLVFAELSDLGSLLLHPGNQPPQFTLQVLLLLAILGCIYLVHQLLMLTVENKHGHRLLNV